MRAVQKIIRAENWFAWKLPPLLAVGYSLLLVGNIGTDWALRTLPFLVLCVCSVAAFGHMVNDVFDIACDAAAGRENVMARLPGWQRLVFIVASAVAGLAAVAVLPGNPLALVLLVFNYALPFLYSAPPVRLKERGIAGILSDALAAHGIPTLLFAAVLIPIGDARAFTAACVTGSAFVWAFGIGFRGILVHQLQDRRSDVSVNVKTFATKTRRKTIRFLVLRVALPLEITALAVFLLFVAPVSRLLAFVALAYLISETVKVLRSSRVTFLYRERPGLERYVPLVSNNFYEIWLPSTLAVQLVLNEPQYAWIGLVHVLLFGRMMARRLMPAAKSLHRSVLGPG